MSPVRDRPASAFRLRLDARPESAALLRRRLQGWLDESGADEDEAFDVLLACSEAFANAVEHPLRPTASVIDVDGQVDEDGLLTLTIRDYGAWRDHAYREARSFGLPLMRSLMSSVEVNPRPEGSWIILRRPVGHGQGD